MENNNSWEFKITDIDGHEYDVAIRATAEVTTQDHAACVIRELCFNFVAKKIIFVREPGWSVRLGILTTPEA